MQKAILHLDNCYKYPNVKVVGHLCKTNIASNTAFRGFGTPQAHLVAESVQYSIASACGLSHIQVKY